MGAYFFRRTDMIIFYSTGCPKCKVLLSKLKEKKIDFVESADIDFLLSKGFTSVPVLEVDGVLLDFKRAIDWINGR